jgi:hypothetical protein
MRRCGMIILGSLVLTLVGCSSDNDGDGYTGKKDCDDNDAGIHPGADEICDGIDNNCNGSVDEGLILEWFADADGDMYGDLDTIVSACNQPDGYVPNSDDCDDGNDIVHPLAIENDCEDPTDYNCDGSVQYDDADEDGFPACNDCDDTISDITGPSTYYIDYDNDGYGSSYYTQLACEEPIGWTDNDEDCDDLKRQVNPDTVWYTDADGDSYGDAETGIQQCESPEENSVRDDTDCDDTDAEVNPDTLWFVDLDGDGYGSPGDYQTGCEQPDGHAPNGLDCSDDPAVNPNAPDINPDAVEVCDVQDNDCDGAVDESDAVDARIFYVDSDGDGYGQTAATTISCWAPSGYAAESEDCDDLLAQVNPGQDEVCGDGLDNNCDGEGGDCTMDATSSLAVFTGAAAGDEAGIAVAGGADMDGDGLDDLIIGARHESTAGSQAGAVYVVYGSDLLEGDITLGDPSQMDIITGEFAGDKAGRIVSVGEVSGDAYPDLLVAAPSADPSGDVSGAAYVVFGPVGSGSLADADVKFTGRTGYNYAGVDIVSGDLNGDDDDDLFIGAIGNDVGGANSGTVYIINGPIAPGTIAAATVADYITGEDPNDEIGTPLRALDLDGDGVDELLLGVASSDGGGANSGAVYVVQGPVSGALSLADADIKYVGESAGDKLGTSVSSVGDIDGDGTLDFVAGAVFDDAAGADCGAAYVVLGDMASPGGDISELASLKIVGESSNDNFGANVDADGDIDGDGTNDFIIGAPTTDVVADSSGTVYIFYGNGAGTVDPLASASINASEADARFEGDLLEDKLGASVGYVGDIDGLGERDAFVIGAAQDDGGGVDAGAVYLIHGIEL